MLEIIDNIGYMKLMDGTSVLAHKKSTEQKIEDNKKTGYIFSNEETSVSRTSVRSADTQPTYIRSQAVRCRAWEASATNAFIAANTDISLKTVSVLV